jgi:BASS family bile acid:Na+ symporter
MTAALALVMLGMGLTLSINDFRSILRMTSAVATGAVIQYTVMPLTALFLGTILRLEPSLAVGLILVACCPGGTASNLITYLARANLALSIIMTSVSTMLAIIVTPLLTKLLAGTLVPVDAWGMFLTTIQVILLPVSLGVYANYRFPQTAKKASISGPLISVLAIVFITGGIVAPSAGIIAKYARLLLIGAALLHMIGFALGYVITKLLRYKEKEAITVSIEAGMQNGGLAAVLARQNFPLLPLVAIPAVFSAFLQTVIGGILAAYWSWKTSRNMRQNDILKNSSKKSGD